MQAAISNSLRIDDVIALGGVRLRNPSLSQPGWIKQLQRPSLAWGLGRWNWFSLSLLRSLKRLVLL